MNPSTHPQRTDWPGTIQTRVARPSRNLDDTVRFYRDGVGFTVIASWQDHDGYNGTVLAIGDASRQLELLEVAGVDPAPTSEDQLVLYLGSSAGVRSAVDRIRAAGYEPSISPNPYWAREGAECFSDPDGYWLILSPSTWA